MLGKGYVVFAALAISAFAQSRIPPEQSRRLDLILYEAATKQTLPCDAEPPRPFLDFAFRFEIGYLVRCPLKEFGAVETTIAAHIRVQPANQNPVWFSEWYRIPGLPSDTRLRFNLQRDRSDIEFSGVIAAGEGEYAVDLVVLDRQHRLFHRSWKTRVCAHGGDTRVPLSMPANTVAAVGFPDWQRAISERNLGRLTLLVDAVPIHSGSTRLRAWDRAFLMNALSSVLTLLPSNTTRVVAFNLDQYREIFRTDDFTRAEATRFSQALEELELGKVSYRDLEQSQAQGPYGMLLALLSQETSTVKPPDAIILLGPANRLSDKVPAQFVADHRRAPPIFYLKYSPVSPARLHLPLASIMGMREDMSNDLADLETGDDGGFPDIIQHTIALYDGVTINLHSPAGLADALKKIDHRLRSDAPAQGQIGR